MNTINEIRPPFTQFNGHLQTIVPSVFRKVRGVSYQRERITTPDDDFLDLDWCLNGGSVLLILSHGLEGDSSRGYIKGMVAYFKEKGWDVLAWNYRGCSGEVNKQIRYYHSGATEDLESVIQHVLQNSTYQKICLVGFSLGGNLTLKYLGERGANISERLSKAMVFSTPLDLHASCLKICKGFNLIYSYRFLRKLKKKIRLKASYYPGHFDLKYLKKVQKLLDFDDAFTAPIHGFKNAIHYYDSCSAQKFMMDIKIPTRIVNARNDPFLAPSCYPEKQLKSHPNLELMIPPKGGHCGFRDRNHSKWYWSEKLAWNYLNS